MNQFLLGIAVAMVPLGAASTANTQSWLSFDKPTGDPNEHLTLCQKELPPPDADDRTAISGRIWDSGCAKLDVNIEAAEFSALQTAAEKGNTAERDAYHAVKIAFESYKKQFLDIGSNLCAFGTGCGPIEGWENAHVNYEFLLMAEGFRGAGFPSFSADETAESDAALNSAYARVLTGYRVQCDPTGDEMDAYCVSRSEVRDMERAWIRYRDAWVAYGAIKWPKVTADSWRAYLTRQHTGNGGDLQLGDF